MSNSVRPHRWKPTRLPHPKNSPGKNTGVGCHFLLQCVNVKSLSRVRLLATPWTAGYLAPPSMGFSRQEYWSGVPILGFYLAIFKSFFLDLHGVGDPSKVFTPTNHFPHSPFRELHQWLLSFFRCYNLIMNPFKLKSHSFLLCTVRKLNESVTPVNMYCFLYIYSFESGHLSHYRDLE